MTNESDALIARLERERDVWRALVQEFCTEWSDKECRPECDSFGHSENCGVYDIRAAFRNRNDRIAALEAEVERLTLERDTQRDITDREFARARAATERAQAAEQDARRYRWLTGRLQIPSGMHGNPVGLRFNMDSRVHTFFDPAQLDAAIDAALAAPQGDTP